MVMSRGCWLTSQARGPRHGSGLPATTGLTATIAVSWRHR